MQDAGDLGFQYDFISYLDVQEGKTLPSRFKVVILPKTACLSEREAQALREFVDRGRVLLIAHMEPIDDRLNGATP